MAQKEVKKLDSGDTFPTIAMTMIDHSTLTLPDALKGNWAILLIYRGRW